MSFSGIVNPEQLKTLTGVLREHCQEKGFAIKSTECNEVGRLLVSLFEMGWRSPRELKAMLAVERGEMIIVVRKRPPFDDS